VWPLSGSTPLESPQRRAGAPNPAPSAVEVRLTKLARRCSPPARPDISTDGPATVVKRGAFGPAFCSRPGCRKPFTPRRAGRPQRFCSRVCRRVQGEQPHLARLTVLHLACAVHTRLPAYSSTRSKSHGIEMRCSEMGFRVLRSWSCPSIRTVASVGVHCTTSPSSQSCSESTRSVPS
jgi:hypothetical protein